MLGHPTPERVSECAERDGCEPRDLCKEQEQAIKRTWGKDITRGRKHQGNGSKAEADLEYRAPWEGQEGTPVLS